MVQRAAATVARSVLPFSIVAVSVALATLAGPLGSAQPAGAGTGPNVPGAPTRVSALPEPAGASVDWRPPSSDGGAPITRYRILATDLTDPAHGGQRASTTGFVGQIVQGLTAGNSYTFTVTAGNSAGTGPASAPSNVVVPTSPPPPRGITCEHVTGTTSGVVTLMSCRSGGKAAGHGTVPGRVFLGKRTGVISWSSGKSYSTTVSTTTSLDASGGTWCVRHGYRGQYTVRGKVTANSDPDIAVGQSVYGLLCISTAGAVAQAHYGYLTL